MGGGGSPTCAQPPNIIILEILGRLTTITKMEVPSESAEAAATSDRATLVGLVRDIHSLLRVVADTLRAYSASDDDLAGTREGGSQWSTGGATRCATGSNQGAGKGDQAQAGE
jgi:hypothetical protein